MMYDDEARKRLVEFVRANRERAKEMRDIGRGEGFPPEDDSWHALMTIELLGDFETALAEIDRMTGLLCRAMPIVRNDVLMCDSFSRHGGDVIGPEDAAKVEASEYTSLVLLREICAAIGESTGLYGEP